MAAQISIDTRWRAHLMHIAARPHRHVRRLLTNLTLPQLVEHPVLSFIQRVHHGLKLLDCEWSYPSIEVVLNADFESEQGERYFDQMTDNLQRNMGVIAQMLKVPIKVSTDAGY